MFIGFGTFTLFTLNVKCKVSACFVMGVEICTEIIRELDNDHGDGLVSELLVLWVYLTKVYSIYLPFSVCV